MRNRNRKGFTLIELLIVIAIIGILAAVLIPNLLRARAVSQDRAAQAYARNVYTAGQAYLAENIQATVADITSVACTDGYAIAGYAVDAWNPILTCVWGSAGDIVTVTYTGGTVDTQVAP